MRLTKLSVLLGTIASTLISTTAFAQEQDDAADTEPPMEEDADGVRFRAGVSAVAGGALIDYSGFLGGVDGRLGVQINDLIGVYAVPHLSFGPVEVSGINSAIGVFGGTGVVDVTLIDHFFVGAGGGFGIFNNPTGPIVHARAGAYPLMGFGDNGIRRKGLSLGVDMRTFFLEGSLTVMQVTGGIGYDAF